MDLVCHTCFSDTSVQKFKANSDGLIVVPSISECRAHALEDVSTDGDSVVTTYSVEST